MLHKTLNLATAISLLLCVSTAILWTRSYRHPATLSLERTVGRWYCLSIQNGDAVWEARRCDDPESRKPMGLMLKVDNLADGEELVTDWPPAYGPHFAGFAFGNWATTETPSDNLDEQYLCRGIQTPLWLFLAVSLLLPVNWIWALALRGRQARRGRCAKCGYDLRATPDLCPECGATRRKGNPAAA